MATLFEEGRLIFASNCDVLFKYNNPLILTLSYEQKGKIRGLLYSI